MGKVYCQSCNKKCSGNVLRVNQAYYHIPCFTCHQCGKSISKGGFIPDNSNPTVYYCNACYQERFARCAICNQIVTGNVITVFKKTFHQDCLKCYRCRQPLHGGGTATWNGTEVLCSRCVESPIIQASASQQIQQQPQKQSTLKQQQIFQQQQQQFNNSTPTTDEIEGRNVHSNNYNVTNITNNSYSNNNDSGALPICYCCHKEISDGQALIAMDKHWHLNCFKCESCGCILHGEYLSKDGKVYCEKDYQKQFGIKCHHCKRYITGKVLQAGDNHFHPTCARCLKCGDVFSDGEEMYIQANAIWHPKCGPGPGEKLDDLNTLTMERQLGETSPYLDEKNQTWTSDMSRYYTYSYLTSEPTSGYLKRPVEPRTPKSPQFHRPPDYQFSRYRTLSARSPRQGMRVMVDHLQTSSMRPKSPSMNNEEPIELSHYPSGQKPNTEEVPKIERDDFPAPPFPYADPNMKKLLGSRDGLEEEIISKERQDNFVSPQLKKEEEELSKIESGIGKVFLKNVKEREKIMAYRKNNLDPRNASRTPSAKTEIPTRLRYDNPVNASPSRDLDRPKPWEEDEYDRYFSRNSRLTRSQPYINYNVVSSLRNTPKPGYTSLGKGRENGVESPLSERYMQKTQSAEFGSKSSALSDHAHHHVVSPGQQTPIEGNKSPRYYMNHSVSSTFRSTPYSEGNFATFRGNFGASSFSPHFRRSMPNVNLQHLSQDPPRQYPYHLLMITNYRLPDDVDRCHLERHLENSEFEQLFNMSRMDFYRLPEWKRNELKKRIKLF